MKQIYVKKNYLAFFLYVLLTVAAAGCSSPVKPVNSNSTNSNLLKNSSFTVNGKPSLEYWQANDTAKVKFVNDIPSQSSYISVGLKSVDGIYGRLEIPGGIYQSVNLPVGSRVYTFSFWARNDSSNYGYASLQTFNNDTLKSTNLITVTSTSWKEYSMNITLSSQELSTIRASFFGGVSDGNYGETLFNQCSLSAK